MATPTKLVTEKDPRKLDVKKGDMVRLLVPHFDGVQVFQAGEEIAWYGDTPPNVEQACMPNEKQTPLDAPAMTDGKPPADYIDPRTGEKLPPPPAA